MANIGLNRSPSPLSSRNCRNSETNSATRRSFNGNPFSRANSPINPPTTDHTKRNLTLVRKSTGSSSTFQDEKENHKDVIRSPAAKGGSKNFMAPTISAASKITPSPRKKILGEKKDLKSVTFDETVKTIDEPVEQKETVLEVTLSSGNYSTEMLSDVKIRPFCCSPISSPIIAPFDSDPYLPPYDPKNNFLSPRPQFLRYKPNRRIENLLKKEGNDDFYGVDVTTLEDSFNLTDNSSDAEVEVEVENKHETEAELGDSVLGSSENLSEIVFEDKQSVTRLEDSFTLSDNSSDTKVDVEVENKHETEAELGDSVRVSSEILSENVLKDKKSNSEVKITLKTRFFTRSKTVSVIFMMFLVACYSVSFTDLPPMDLPIYQDVTFSEIYHESLKFAGFAKQSFDVLVENVKNWSIDFISYLSHQKSQLFSTHKISSIQFFNLTTSHIQEEFVFNRHVGTDYIQNFNEETQEFDEQMQEFDEEMEFDDDIDVEDEALIDNTEVEDEIMTEEINEVKFDKQIKNDDNMNLEDGSVIESKPEPEIEEFEIKSKDESETLTSVFTKSMNTIYLASFFMVIMAAKTIFYMKKTKSNASKTAKIYVSDESGSSESSSVEKGHKKKSIPNKRESLASSSSSDFSMSCSPSYGSFTTFERIANKPNDGVMLTPIRRSSRLRKTQMTSS